MPIFTPGQSLFGGSKKAPAKPKRKPLLQMPTTDPKSWEDIEPPKPKRAYYKFSLDGKEYKMPLDDVTQEPSDFDLEQFAYDQENKSLWQQATEPLTHAAGEKLRGMSEEAFRAGGMGDVAPGPLGKYNRGLGAFYGGLAEQADAATSPLGLATLGGGVAAKGLYGATAPVRAIGQVGRASEALGGAAIGGHGLSEMYQGYQESDPKRAGWGALETAMGGMGLYGASTRGPKAPPKRPPITEPIALLGRQMETGYKRIGAGPTGGAYTEGEIIPPDAPYGGRGVPEPPGPRDIWYSQEPIEPPGFEPQGPFSAYPRQGRGRPTGPYGEPIEPLGLPRSTGLQRVSDDVGSVVEIQPEPSIPNPRFGLSRPPSEPKPPIPPVGPFYGAVGRRKGVSTDISDVVAGRRDRQQTGMTTYPESMLRERAAARDPEAMIELRRREITGQGLTPEAPAPIASPRLPIPAPPPATRPPVIPPPPPAPPIQAPPRAISSPGEQLLTAPRPTGKVRQVPQQAPPPPPAPPVISEEGLTGPAGDVGPLIDKLQGIVGKQALPVQAPVQAPPPPVKTVDVTPSTEQVALALERMSKPELATQMRANPQIKFKSPSGAPVLTVKEAERVAQIFIEQGKIAVPKKAPVPAAKAKGGIDLEAVTPGKMEEGGIPTPYEGFKNGKILELARHGNPLAITEATRRRIDKYIRQEQPPVSSKMTEPDWKVGDSFTIKGEEGVHTVRAIRPTGRLVGAPGGSVAPDQAVHAKAPSYQVQYQSPETGKLIIHPEKFKTREEAANFAETANKANSWVIQEGDHRWKEPPKTSEMSGGGPYQQLRAKAQGREDVAQKLRKLLDERDAKKAAVSDKQLETLIRNMFPDAPDARVKYAVMSQKAYDKLIPAEGNVHVDYDAGGRYTPEELARVQKSPEMKKIANVIEELALELTERLGAMTRFETQKFGFVYDNGIGGYNLPDVRSYAGTGSRKSALLVNAMSAMRHYTPTQAADAIVHRVMHEFTHNIERSEGSRYTTALAHVKAVFGSRAQVDYANEIERAISTPDGRYRPEVQDLLQDYIKSRGRGETEPDLIRRSLEGIKSEEGGQEAAVVRREQAREGTPERGVVEKQVRTLMKMGLAQSRDEALAIVKAQRGMKTVGPEGLADAREGPRSPEAKQERATRQELVRAQKARTVGDDVRLQSMKENNPFEYSLTDWMQEQRVMGYSNSEIKRAVRAATRDGIDPTRSDDLHDLEKHWLSMRDVKRAGEASEGGNFGNQPIKDWYEKYVKGKFGFGSKVTEEGFDIGSGPDPVEFGKRAFRFGRGVYEGTRKAWQESGRPSYDRAKKTVREQAQKTEPSKWTHETAREVKYSSKAFLRSFPDIVRGIGQSGLTTLDKMGPGGKALSKIIQQARIYEEQLAARYIKGVTNEREIERLAKRAQEETWERYFRSKETSKKGEAYYDWEKLDKMIAKTEDKEMARDLVNKYFGRAPATGERYKHAVKSLTEFETAVKLSQFYISNIANVVMTGGKANIGAMGKAIKQMTMSEKGIRASYTKAVAEASETGALQPILSELKQELGMSKKVGHIFGIDKAERLQRTFAAIAGKHTADELFTQIKAGKGGDTARRRLSELLMEDNLDNIMKQSKLSEQQKLFAGNRMSEMTQGRASSIDLPPIWTNHPIMNLMTQFKRYAFNQAKNTNQAFKVDPVRMITAITLMGAGVGEFVGDTKAIMNGIGRSITNDETLMESIKANWEDRGEGGWRIANNIGDAWALGLMLDFIKSAGRGESGVPEFFAGPALQDIGKAASSVWEGIAAGLDPEKESRAGSELFRQGTEMIPFLGRGLSQGLAPRNNPQPRRREMFRR